MTEYIERDALIKRLQENFINRCKADSLCKYVIEKITTFPAAEVEPVRHGVWEWDIGDVYACSLCGEKSHVKEVMEQPVWEYCPNCGARMDGGADNGT